MKLKFLCIALFLSVGAIFGQGLPDNPEPGKCYVRCKTPEVWKTEQVTVMVSPKHKKFLKYPSKYKTVTEKVVTKEAYKKLVIVPAKWKLEPIEYYAKENRNEADVTEATFFNESKTIETRPESAVWEMSEKSPDCESDNPDDCRYWCYKPVPAEFETIPIQRLNKDATVKLTPTGGIKKTYLKRVMLAPETVKEVDVPAEYGTVTRQVIDEDVWAGEVTVDAEYKTVQKEILVSKGGLTSWKPVDCTLMNNTPLPINWDFSSAELNKGAKQIIDSRLLPILKTGIAVKIESHTDMRGTKKDNQILSDLRAKAVFDYLVSKGISTSQLDARGYGESKLKNRCADGVKCTEAEHAVNRRTTFRVVNQR